jgi:hypothetical protein
VAEAAYLPAEQVFRFSERHHGLFTDAAARARSLSAKRVATMQRHGLIERVSPRVLRLCGSPRTWEQEVLIAVWSGGPRCVASVTTAAALHGFDGYRRVKPIEVLLPESCRGYSWKSTVVHHSSLMVPEWCTECAGIPTLDPIATWLSLCATARPERVEEALDGAERDGLIDRTMLEARLEEWRARGRNGVRVAARLLESRAKLAAIPQSRLERRLFRLIVNAGIRAPQCQYPVRRSDGSMAYIDLAWPELRYGNEADGNIAHATPRQRASDNKRQNALLISDFWLSRFTWEQTANEPEYVLRTVKGTIRRRALQFGLDPDAFLHCA